MQDYIDTVIVAELELQYVHTCEHCKHKLYINNGAMLCTALRVWFCYLFWTFSALITYLVWVDNAYGDQSLVLIWCNALLWLGNGLATCPGCLPGIKHGDCWT